MSGGTAIQALSKNSVKAIKQEYSLCFQGKAKMSVGLGWNEAGEVRDG